MSLNLDQPLFSVFVYPLIIFVKIIKNFKLFFYLQITNISQCQASVSFHIETIHVICSGNKMAGFYMEYNAELK